MPTFAKSRLEMLRKLSSLLAKRPTWRMAIERYNDDNRMYDYRADMVSRLARMGS